jgi:hypothetical protein
MSVGARGSWVDHADASAIEPTQVERIAAQHHDRAHGTMSEMREPRDSSGWPILRLSAWTRGAVTAGAVLPTRSPRLGTHQRDSSQFRRKVIMVTA